MFIDFVKYQKQIMIRDEVQRIRRQNIRKFMHPAISLTFHYNKFFPAKGNKHFSQINEAINVIE